MGTNYSLLVKRFGALEINSFKPKFQKLLFVLIKKFVLSFRGKSFTSSSL